MLPAHIAFDTNDIASLFKRYLIELPGGILGSARVYMALKDIHENLRPDPAHRVQTVSKEQAVMIAMCISSIASPYRVKLICAVFGLLAMVGRSTMKAEDQLEKDVENLRSEFMTYRALGVCFSPALLGDMAETLKHDAASGDGSLDMIAEIPGPQANSVSQYQLLLSQAQNVAQSDAKIVEMIIVRWKMICSCLKMMGTIQREHDAVLIEKKQRPSGQLSHSRSGSDLFLRLSEINPSNTTSIRQSIHAIGNRTTDEAQLVEDQARREESQYISHGVPSRPVIATDDVPFALGDPFECQPPTRRPTKESLLAEKRRCCDWGAEWDEATEAREKAKDDSKVLKEEKEEKQEEKKEEEEGQPALYFDYGCRR
jgi:hypothetical protein